MNVNLSNLLSVTLIKGADKSNRKDGVPRLAGQGGNQVLSSGPVRILSEEDRI